VTGVAGTDAEPLPPGCGAPNAVPAAWVAFGVLVPAASLAPGVPVPAASVGLTVTPFGGPTCVAAGPVGVSAFVGEPDDGVDDTGGTGGSAGGQLGCAGAQPEPAPDGPAAPQPVGGGTAPLSDG